MTAHLRRFGDLPGVGDLGRLAAKAAPWSVEEEHINQRAPQVSTDLFGILVQHTQFDFDKFERDHWDDDDWYEEEEEEEPDAPPLTEARKQQLWDQSPVGVAYAKWEEHFKLLDYEFSSARLVWEAMGWDVSDGQGQQHPALQHLGRQLLCAIHKLAGHLPDDGVNAAGVRSWAADMEREAQAFRKTRGRR